MAPVEEPEFQPAPEVPPGKPVEPERSDLRPMMADTEVKPAEETSTMEEVPAQEEPSKAMDKDESSINEIMRQLDKQ